MPESRDPCRVRIVTAVPGSSDQPIVAEVWENSPLSASIRGEEVCTRLLNYTITRLHNYSMSSGTDQGTNLFPGEDAFDVAAAVEIEDDDRQVVVLAQADGGRVHHLQSLLQHVHVA